MKGMKIWLVTLVMAFVLEAQGQGWMKTYEQPGYQIAYGVAPTAEGGVLALASGGTSLLKVDGSGNLLFEKNLDEGIPNVIISVPDGNFAVAGIIYQNIMDNNAGNDSIYVFLTKVNPNGDIIWHNKLLISTYAQDAAINALVTDPNGGFKLAGFYGSGDPMGSIFFKADASGNIEILNTLVLGGDNSAKDVILNPDGDFVVAGQVDSSLFGSNYRGPYLIKASNAGVKIWGETYENNTVFNSLVNAANGGYMVAGDANQNASDKNPLCLKVDDNGNEIWQKKWIDIKATINDIIIAQGGGYYLFGNTFKGPYDNIPDNLLLIKIDENGNELWRKIFGSLSWEEGRQLFQTQAGNLFIGGGAYSSSSSYDVLLAKLDSLGNIYASAITGSVHFDPESDCQFDPTEPGLAGWLVQAIGIQSSTTLTDTSGNYFLAVDTGNYELQIIPPVGPYWEVCNSPYQVDISNCSK